MKQKIPELLRVAREKKGLTQMQLAEAAGVSQPTVSQIERGTGNPRLSVLEAVGAVLGVEPSMVGSEVEAIDLSTMSTEDAEMVRLLLRALPKMSARERYGMLAELKSYDHF